MDYFLYYCNMGTNYYGMKIPTYKEKEVIKAAVDVNDWGLVYELLPEKIHLGKSSGGWEFCFDHNYWQYFGKCYKEMKEFIGSCAIIDEYGRSITHKEFWEKVEAKKGGLMGDDDIVINGLRFANYSDFT